jgi:hypothetical protein
MSTYQRESLRLLNGIIAYVSKTGASGPLFCVGSSAATRSKKRAAKK